MVLHLQLDKQHFKYLAGQYCFLNVPEVSVHEWHPFTISSAPSEETLQFHIRCVGDWTTSIRNLFDTDDQDTFMIKNPVKSYNGDPITVKVDGPFGTAASEVYHYKYVMLVAAGIGVTPFASLLKHLKYLIEQKQQLKIRKVFFYWINRDTGSWEWFAKLLDQLEDEYPDFFVIHTYMTGSVKQVDQTTGYQRIGSSDVVVRACYDYPAQTKEEIDLERGDEVEVLSQDQGYWWYGTNRDSEVSGLFPSDYVVNVDTITKLRQGENRHIGRPNWSKEFNSVREYVVSQKHRRKSRLGRPNVGVFFCGPSVLSKQLHDCTLKESNGSAVQFRFLKENF
jgi:predicted ferric reductase